MTYDFLFSQLIPPIAAISKNLPFTLGISFFVLSHLPCRYKCIFMYFLCVLFLVTNGNFIKAELNDACPLPC